MVLILLISCVIFLASVGWKVINNVLHRPAWMLSVGRTEDPGLTLLPPGTPNYGGTLVVGITADPQILNPLLSEDTISIFIMTRLFNNLFANDETLSTVPELVKDWKFSPDGLTLELSLREGVFWHDGNELTAQDVKFTYDQILQGKAGQRARASFRINGKDLQFIVVDRYRIRLLLPAPYPGIFSKLAFPIIPQHLYQDTDIRQNEHNFSPVGTGPFFFERWERGEYLSMAANKRYYQGRPYVDRLIFKIVSDQKKILDELKKGTIHAAELSSNLYQEVNKASNLNVYLIDTSILQSLGFNLRHPFLKDVQTRKAIAYAVDKDALIKSSAGGLGVISNSHYPPKGFSSFSTDRILTYTHSVEDAARLLKEAGWEDIDKDGILEREGAEFRISILTNLESQQRVSIATTLCQQLSKVGIAARVETAGFADTIKRLRARDFDAVVLGFDLTPNPDQYNYWHSSRTTEGFNFFGYQNPEIDQLLEAGRVSTDGKAMKKIYDRVQWILSDDLPTIPLYFVKIIFVQNKAIVAPSYPSSGGPYLYVHKWYIKDGGMISSSES